MLLGFCDSDWVVPYLKPFPGILGDNIDGNGLFTPGNSTLTNWIHTDSERAKVCSPLKSTIAHGFLTLALRSALTEAIDPKKVPYPEAMMVMIYGLNKVLYLYPIKSGSRVRTRIHLVRLTPIKHSIEESLLIRLVRRLRISIAIKLKFTQSKCC